MKTTLLIIALACAAFGQQPVVRATTGSAYVLLGKLASANFNITTDQAITLNLPTGTTKYAIEKIDITNCAVNLTTAAGGIYTTTAKGGSQVVASTQIYTALTGTVTQLLNPTLNLPTTTFSATSLQFSLTTPQGGAAIGDIYVWGRVLP